MKTYDAIVIGSGIGGLTAAGILASRGLNTMVMEKNIRPGGYITSFTRRGVVFDSAVDCMSGAGPGGLIHRVLQLLGMEDSLRFIRIDPVRFSIFPDIEVAVDADIDAYKERLTGLFPAEASALSLFFDRTDSAFRQMQSALEAVISGSLAPGLISPDMLCLMNGSYEGFLDDFFTDFRLKAALSDRCPFIGLPPSGVSAAAMINMIMSYFQLGAYRPEGGFQRLADIFVEGIRNKGGSVVLGRGVRRIRLDSNNRCEGVICDDGEEYTARYVVSNADFDQTFRQMLGDGYAQLADDMLKDPGISTSFFITYAVAEGSVGGNSSIGFYPSYDMKRFFGPITEVREDSTIGMTIASIEDKTRAPQNLNTVVLHEMIDTSAGGLDKNVCIERTLKKAERIFPGIRSRLTVVDAATPSTLHRYTGNCRGSAFGWKQKQGFRGPKRHGIANLFIAGHWGEFGGGVLAAAYAGAKAAGEILLREGIRDVI